MADDFRKDHRRIWSWFQILLCFIILLVGLGFRLGAEILDLRGQKGIFSECVGELGTFIAVVTLVTLIYEGIIRREERHIILQDMEDMLDRKLEIASKAIRVFPEGRAPIEEKLKLVSSAKSEVVEVGIALRTFASYFESRPANAFKNPVIELLRQGINFRCLMLDPHSRFAEQFQDEDLRTKLRNSFATLSKLQAEFKALNLLGTFRIYFYDHQPFFSAIAVDAGFDRGRMYFSPYLCDLQNAEAPAFEIQRSEQPIMFQSMWRSIENQFSRSTETPALDSRQNIGSSRSDKATEDPAIMV